MAVLNVPSSFAGTCGCGGTLIELYAEAAARCSQCGFKVTRQLLFEGPWSMRQAYEQYERARRYVADQGAWSSTCVCGAPWSSVEQSVEHEEFNAWQTTRPVRAITRRSIKVSCPNGHDVVADVDTVRVVEDAAGSNRRLEVHDDAYPQPVRPQVSVRARENGRRHQQVVEIAGAIMRGEDVMVAVTTMQRGVVDYGKPVADLLMRAHDVRIRRLGPGGLVVLLPCGRPLGRLDFVTPNCPSRVRGARPNVVLYDELAASDRRHRSLMAEMAVLEHHGARSTLAPPTVVDPIDFIVQMVDFRCEEIDDVELEWDDGSLWATVHLAGSSWDPEYDFTAAEVVAYNRQRRR